MTFLRVRPGGSETPGNRLWQRTTNRSAHVSVRGAFQHLIALSIRRRKGSRGFSSTDRRHKAGVHPGLGHVFATTIISARRSSVRMKPLSGMVETWHMEAQPALRTSVNEPGK